MPLPELLRFRTHADGSARSASPTSAALNVGMRCRLSTSTSRRIEEIGDELGS